MEGRRPPHGRDKLQLISLIELSTLSKYTLQNGRRIDKYYLTTIIVRE